MSEDPNIRVHADTEPAKQEVDDFARQVKVRQRQLASGLRQTAELGLVLVEVSGQAINELHRLYVETALRAIEVTLGIRAALAATTLGASEVLAIGLQAAAVVSLSLTILAIQREQADSARRLKKLADGFRLMTYMIALVPSPVLVVIAIMGVLQLWEIMIHSL